MLKWAIVLGVLGGTVQAATVTYAINTDLGVFIDGEYGGRDAVRALYEQEVLSNQLEYDDCVTQGWGGCETALQFEDYRVRLQYGLSGPISFDDYYDMHIDAAGQAGFLNTWQSGDLTIVVPSFGGFYPYGYSAQGLIFGSVVDGGESVGPSNIWITLPADKVFVSIDLRVTSVSLGSVNGVGFGAGYDGTYLFDTTSGVSQLWLGAGPLDVSGAHGSGTMYFDNIVVQTAGPSDVADVPLPGSLAAMLLGLGLLGAGRARRG